jgi:hypothetical protein
MYRAGHNTKADKETVCIGLIYYNRSKDTFKERLLIWPGAISTLTLEDFVANDFYFQIRNILVC